MVRFIYPRRFRCAFTFSRFLARWADFGLVFWSFRLFLRPLGLIDWPSYFDWYAALVVAMLVNAIALNLCGTTVWKSALGLRVERIDGGTPGFFQALKRELLVTILGMGCGLPLLAVPAGIFWGWRVITGRRSFWNKTSGLVSKQTDFPKRSIERTWGRVTAVLLSMLLLIEVWLILFYAARYEVGWIIVGL